MKIHMSTKMRLNLIILVLLALLVPKYLATEPKIENRVLKWIQGDNSSSFVGKGKMNGCFSDDDIWNIHKALRESYPQYVTKRFVFGHTYQKKDLPAFFLQNSDGKILTDLR